MEVSTFRFKIDSPQDIKPTDINVVGIKYTHVIIKYKINDVIYFIEFSTDKTLNLLFFELLNNSPLWNLSYKIMRIHQNKFDIELIVNVEKELINEYINKSMALNYLINVQASDEKMFTDTDLDDTSIIPFCDPVDPPSEFKVNLYYYQKKTLAKMLQIENNNNDFIINYSLNVNFKDVDILLNPVFAVKVDNECTFNIRTNGGILSDEMGLGKTISCIALIASNPASPTMNKLKRSKKISIQKISSKATVILCLSHLVKQWEGEIRKCYPKLVVKTILSKNDYKGLTFNTFINSDVIITSHQFIMNFKFYPTLHYRKTTPTSFRFSERNIMIQDYLNNVINNIGFPGYQHMECPIFEFFYFHRIILDEGHEIFGDFSTTSTFMATWVSNIDAQYCWYVSGTPFINFTGVINCAKFINLSLEDSDSGLLYNYNKNNKNITDRATDSLLHLLNKEYIWKQILSKVCIRHRKVDIENQVQIPGYEEKIIWLKFTDIERQLYNAKIGKVSKSTLQQLCCHPLIAETSKKIFGNVEVDLVAMQDKLIDYHKSNYNNYKNKLTTLDPRRQEFHMLKKTYETHMSESKYLFTILEKMKKPELLNEENCSICMDVLNKPTLTACGHLFCYECIKLCFGDKRRCPMCKTDLTGKDLLVTNLKNADDMNLNPLIQKYGSKLGKLISIIRYLVTMEDSRIIIFSQWDNMLSLIGKTLAENEIDNSFVKGNAWSRNSAIRKFKAGKNMNGSDNKVIMLSLKNAASGTNLTEATHIFFVEPIDACKEECKAIEGQAIARACRIGQRQKIMLIRILIENSVEEEIFRKNYNNGVVVSFEDSVFSDNIINNIKLNTTNEPKLKRSTKKKKALDIEV